MVGEVELRIQNRLRHIQYFKVKIKSGGIHDLGNGHISGGSSTHILLRSMNDIKITPMATHILEHFPSQIGIDPAINPLNA